MALALNSLTTFGMLLILTYQLQVVMRYPPLTAGLALTPFAVAAVTAAGITPRLTRVLCARTVIVAGLAVCAVGLLPLVALTPTCAYASLVVLAAGLQGVGSGLTAPSAPGARVPPSCTALPSPWLGVPGSPSPAGSW